MNLATCNDTADCPLFKSEFRITLHAEPVELGAEYQEKYAICETWGWCVS